MRLQRLNRRQARWSLELSEFNFKLSYAPGKDNPADAPLHHPDFIPGDGDIVKEINWQTLLSPEQTEWLWTKATSTSSAPALTGPSATAPPVTLTAPSPPVTTTAPSPPATTTAPSPPVTTAPALADNAHISQDEWEKAIHSGKKGWEILNGVPFFRHKIYVLPELRGRILHEHHDSLLMGHLGRSKTLSLISRDYNWPLISKEVQLYVWSCNTCQQTKASHHAPYGMLIPLKIPERNWEEISMDFITDLPQSHTFDSILVVVDRLTKQAHFIPTHKSLNAPGLAQLFIVNIFKLHGFPSSIVSD